MQIIRLAAIPLLLAAAGHATAQQIVAPFDRNYSFRDLGVPPGVPTPLGGVTFKIGEPNTVYIGGSANRSTGAVYKLTVQRDAQRRITGFSGTATKFADAPNIDGGLQFGPGGVLFFTRYSNNELGQIKPGSNAMDKSVLLTPLGVASSVGALQFVAAGYPNAGKLKVMSYNASRSFTLDLSADGNGTFNVTNSTNGTTIQGGPEGFFFVPPDSPQFVNFKSMAVSEYSASTVAIYDVDNNADPILSSRRPFMTGVGSVEGAAIDPVTGAFVFSTFGSGTRMLVVDGFGLPCGRVQSYGTGTAGGGNVTPTLDTAGCFARRQAVSFDVASARPSAPGVMLVGLQQQNIVLFGVRLLVVPVATFNHSSTAQGTWSLPFSIADDTNLLNTDFFAQSIYLDPGAATGLSASAGMVVRVR